MKAVRVERPGGREALLYTDVPDPTPEHGQVLVAIEFVGVNTLRHAEVVIRQLAEAAAVLTTYLLRANVEPSEQLRHFIGRLSLVDTKVVDSTP